MFRPVTVLRARHGKEIESQGGSHTASKNNAALSVIPDHAIILGVLPSANFLIAIYTHRKAREIKHKESVLERLGMDL
jgi:hypothetical protein